MRMNLRKASIVALCLKRAQGRSMLGRLWASLLVLAMSGVTPSAAATGCAEAGAVPWQQAAPGIWIWPAAENNDVSHANRGHVMPTTLIVSRGEALVIDPGPSHRHGLRVRESVECRFDSRVRWLVNTHAHAENVMGNSAFADLLAAGQLDILASGATRSAMALRCPDCLASLSARAGADAMAGTRIVLPNRTIVSGERLSVGDVRLQVQAIEAGHTEGDLVLWNVQHQVLWAGGLVYDKRVPELAQGSLDGWIAALQRLCALRPEHVVSTVWSRESSTDKASAALRSTLDYLVALRSRVLRAMDEGLQPQDATWGHLPAYRDWAGYGDRHGFNLQRAWRELEPVWMDQGTTPAK